MAHPQQLQFMKTLSQVVCSDYTDMRILEIGSFDVNGSIRNMFRSNFYLGVDLIEGPGVDLCCEGDLVDEPEGSFDMAMSCECFEHNPKWLETFLNMCRMVKPGGVVAFTCATTGRLEHGTDRTTPFASPGTHQKGWNYYKNLKETDFRSRVDFDFLFSDYFFLTNKKSCDLYFVGVRIGSSSDSGFSPVRLFEVFQSDQENLRNAIVAQEKQRSWPVRALVKLVDIPIKILVFLPERHFQNFAVIYSRFVDRLKDIFKSYFLGKST